MRAPTEGMQRKTYRDAGRRFLALTLRERHAVAGWNAAAEVPLRKNLVHIYPAELRR
jgi:hypothetical protein